MILGAVLLAVIVWGKDYSMDAHNPVQEADERLQPSGEGTSTWGRFAKRRLGSLVVTVCPNGDKACGAVNCVFRPLCACVRAEMAQARRIEGRIWVSIACCGAIVLLIALFRALAN